MHVAELRRYLDESSAAAAWLESLGLVDVKKAHANLVGMATRGLTLDLLAVICGQLDRHLAWCADPDMALNNLARFVAEARNPLAMGTLFQRDPDALPTLVQIFSTSQHLSDLLVADPESFDLLRLTDGQPFARRSLVEDLLSEVKVLEHDRTVLNALRRFKRRETLRISFGDICREQSLATVTKQISYLADAVLEAALDVAWRKIVRRRGTPYRDDGRPARFVVLGLGKLGGVELNYSSDIDLILLYDGEGRTDHRRKITNAEFFDHLARELVRLLVERTEMGSIYRVDLRLRPEGDQGPMVISLPAALQYYENRGRTWERQAFIKARPVAGDLQLGREFLEQLTPWIYRRYLSRADITGIRALKRRIERRAKREGGGLRNVKTGRGGIRDVEFVIQFLQLLNGGDLPKLRTPNTLEAIGRLHDAGCLTNLESTLLADNYSFLRKIEHRLQIMFDLQTHLLPAENDERRKLALRMGYADEPGRTALSAFEEDYRSKTALNRRILDHLLHDAFSDDADTEAEVDLILDPDPPQEQIAEVLGKYSFRDIKSAYRNLTALAEEKIRFLSTRRCRHFLASIAPGLLEAIASTADPDSTLVNLDKVSDSVGGKGVLWELFSFNPPSLKLYVRLCAYAPYLCSILTSNPGMLDGLMDSLVLNKLPTRESLHQTLTDLCRGAEDLDPIRHSFKNDQQLRVGVRDLLSKENVRAVTGTLSDIAQTCLDEITWREYRRMARKFGQPTLGSASCRGEPCEMAVLAMGKFGGREMNYHSDLDIVFLYQGHGQTAPPPSTAGSSTTNQHFFSQLGQRIIKTTGRLTAYGRLYEVDARLRPTGKSGVLATSLDEFERYFAQGDGQLWERQALCKARVVVGSKRMAAATMEAVNRAAFDHEFRRRDADQIRRMRRRQEEAAGKGNLKRGPGGIADIEFAVQMLQLKFGRRTPQIRTPNTLAALEALHEAGYLSVEDLEFFTQSYRFLRSLESRLRLTNFSTSSNQLPDDPTELGRLSHLLRWPSRGALLVDFDRYLSETRRRFDRIFDVAGT